MSAINEYEEEDFNDLFLEYLRRFIDFDKSLYRLELIQRIGTIEKYMRLGFNLGYSVGRRSQKDIDGHSITEMQTPHEVLENHLRAIERVWEEKENL